MIDVDEIGSMQIECVKRWHLEPIDNPCDIDGSMSSLAATVCQQNDWIERIDDWITEDLSLQSIQSVEGAKLNTETPGSSMDRLSIMSLRIYHLEEQLSRVDVDESHREKVNNRLAICRLQRHDLSQSLKELLDDIYRGAKRHRTYRQMKMYNDPTLNPYLYTKQLAS